MPLLPEQLDPPRWKGGSVICRKANLPAFETRAEAKAYHDQIGGPRCAVYKVWQCAYCQGWHYLSSAPDPTGGSSGTGRSHKHH
jgi:hypothetical protein